MSLKFDNLPVEVLTHILDFLSAADKIVVSEVCKKWLSVCCSNKLLRDITVIVKEKENFLPIFKNAVRPFCNFHFKKMKIDSDCLSYLGMISEQLSVLHFQSCEFDSVISCDLQKFSQLKELYFEHCDLPKWKINKDSDILLSNLTHFGYSNSTTMTDLTFIRLCNMMPNLEFLSLEFCQVAYNKAACKRFYPSGFSPEHLSDILFSYHSIGFLVKKRSKTISTLNFNNTLLSSSFLSNILKTEGLNLKNISLATGNECMTSLLEIPTFQKNLSSLNLSYMYDLSDDTLTFLCDNLHVLQSLDLNYCQYITEASMKRVFNMKSLKSLHSSNCMGVSEEGFAACVNSSKCSLETLDVTHCNITDEFVYNLIQKQNNLINLNLSYSLITNQSVQKIFKFLLGLKNLNLSYCEKLANFPDDCTLCDMKRLKALVLHGCSNINEGILKTIRFIDLEFLNLTSLPVTDEIVEMIGKHNPCIQDFVLKDCRKLTDEAVNHIILYFHRLKYLELFGCKQLTDKTIHALKNVRSLRYLGIVYCSQITYEAVENLQSQNRKLSIQYYRACE